MKILFVNDDGYKAQGLLQMAYIFSKQHEVYICAPKAERSGSGHAVTFNRKLTCTLIDAIDVTKGTSYEFSAPLAVLDGTPADCTKFAIEHFYKDIKFDLVISGINNLTNIGTDTLYSGTFNAAQEGTLQGIKSIALSTMNDRDDYTYPVEFLMKHLEELMSIMQPLVTLNVNVPSQDPANFKGVKVCVFGHKRYKDWYEVYPDGYMQTGYPYDSSQNEREDDCKFSDQGYVTITPSRALANDGDLLDDFRHIEW